MPCVSAWFSSRHTAGHTHHHHHHHHTTHTHHTQIKSLLSFLSPSSLPPLPPLSLLSPFFPPSPLDPVPNRDDGYDWVEIIEPSSGRKVYANTTSGECLWKPPPGAALYVFKSNHSVSLCVYVCVCRCVCLPPPFFGLLPPPPPVRSFRSFSPSMFCLDHDSKPCSEDQWWELKDAKSGRAYYYNATTKATVWDRPQRGDIVPLAKLQVCLPHLLLMGDGNVCACVCVCGWVVVSVVVLMLVEPPPSFLCFVSAESLHQARLASHTHTHTHTLTRTRTHSRAVTFSCS